MRPPIALLAALSLALVACQHNNAAAQIHAPTLANRQEIIALRDSMARELLQPGDTLTIYVFMSIDEHGIVHQPEVKQQGDAKAIKSAIQLVNLMHFNPAEQDGKPMQVLLKVPVRFARPAAP